MADPSRSTPRIELRVLRAQHTATARESVGRDDVPAAIGRLFQAVSEAVHRQGAKMVGAPFARYHSFGTTVDLEAGTVVAVPIQPDGSVVPSQLPAGPAAVALHIGPYETLSATYASIEAWLTNSGRTASGGPWEVYLTDPSQEPDPHKWRTEVVYPLGRS